MSYTDTVDWQDDSWNESAWTDNDWTASEAGWSEGNSCYVAFREFPAAYVDPEQEALSGFSAARATSGPGISFLDCGATDSFGGDQAVREFEKAYTARFGKEDSVPPVFMDRTDCPSYTFGDGETVPMDGRADLRIWQNEQPATLGMHVVPKAPKVPLLTGNGAMRKMKLAIDFSSGAAVFGSVDPDTVRILDRSANGHLQLDLLKDLSQQGSYLCKVSELQAKHPELAGLAAVVKAGRQVRKFMKHAEVSVSDTSDAGSVFHAVPDNSKH